MPSFIPDDPFSLLEFYAFRAALFVIFMIGLYRLVRREIEK